MKTLLTVHEIDDDISSLQNLIRLAGHAGAHLHVVVLGVVRVVPMTAAPGVPDYYFSEANQEMIAAGKARIKEIEKLIAQENISASVTLECRDPALVEQTIRRHAMFCDAAVFPQLSVPGSDLKSRAMNGALLNAVSPVLVLDPELTQLPDVSIIQFAWSGEIPAAKAVHLTSEGWSKHGFGGWEGGEETFQWRGSQGHCCRAGSRRGLHRTCTGHVPNKPN